MTRSWQLTIVLIGLLLLASCSHQPDHAIQKPVSDGWRMTAKVAMNAPDNKGTGYATFSATPAFFELVVSGPFGNSQTRARCTKTECTVSSSDQDERSYPIFDGRVTMLSDLPLPIAYLPHWLMGNINEPSATLTGWQADISQWQTLNDRKIPKALMLSHGDEYRIKILITSWRPLSATEAL